MDNEIKLFIADNYKGTCLSCGQLFLINKMIVNKFREDNEMVYYWPIEPFMCPHCNTLVGIIGVYKDSKINVTDEFKNLISKIQ
jgi:hypothetical protein